MTVNFQTGHYLQNLNLSFQWKIFAINMFLKTAQYINMQQHRFLLRV